MAADSEQGSKTWDRVRAVFEEVIDLGVDQRQAFLDRLGEEEPDVRDEVLQLLEHDDADQPWLTEAFGRGASFDAGLSEPFEVGRRVGPYRLVGVLGEGGSSTVYRAVRDDEEYHQEVAVKVLRGGRFGPSGIERVRLERQILATLDHPAIARLTDGGSVDGVPYLVMELVDGLPITEHCSRHDLTVDERVELFLQVLDGVQFAHQHLVIHRDLKPSNILVRGDGGAKVLDFGIAKLLDPETMELGGVPFEATRTNSFLMTPGYASPEQVRGRRVSTASDVYSLGVLLFRLLTDAAPYEIDHGDLAEVVRVVTEEQPPLPSRAAPARRRRLAGDLDHIVLKAMAKDPADRYFSAAAFADDLRRHLRGLPVEARAAGIGYRLGKFVRRNRWGVGAALVLLAILGAALWNGQRQHRTTRAALERAESEAHRASSVNDYLVDLLTSVDPRRGLGVDTTLLEAIQQSERDLGTYFGDEADTEARLRWVLSRAYFNLHRPAESLRHAESALDALATLGPDADRDLETRLHIARAAAQSEIDGAGAAIETLLPLVLDEDGEPDLGSGWPAVAAAVDLTTHYFENGQEAESRRWSVLAEERAKTLGPPPRPDDRAALLRMSASLAFQTGEYRTALERFLEISDLFEAAYGPENFDAVEARHSAAEVAYQIGDYELAEIHGRVSAERLAARFGDAPSEFLASSYSLMGLILDARGQQGEAIDWLTRAYDVQRRASESDIDPTLIYQATTLGRLLIEAGRLDEATEIVEEAWDRSREGIPPTHRLYAIVETVLAMLRENQGRTAEAESLYRQALEHRVQSLGSDHLLVAYAQGELGMFLLRRGRAEEAREVLQQAAGRFATDAEPTSAARVRTSVFLARAQLEVGDPESALATATDLLDSAGDAVTVDRSQCEVLFGAAARASELLGRPDEAADWVDRRAVCAEGGADAPDP